MTDYEFAYFFSALIADDTGMMEMDAAIEPGPGVFQGRFAERGKGAAFDPEFYRPDFIHTSIFEKHPRG